jgi:hypothetical protein
MDLEYLFESALVALGPPLPAANWNIEMEEINAQCAAYYALLAALKVVTDEACSYEAFSDWVHAKRR